MHSREEALISILENEIERLTKAIVIQVEQDENAREFGSNNAYVEFFTNRYTEEHFPKGGV